MQIFYVSVGNASSEKWEQLAAIPLRPYSELYPEHPTEGVYGLVNEVVVLPNGEQLQLYASFAESNFGTNFGAISRNTTLLNVGGYEKTLASFEPAAFFLTPGGMHVSLCVGPEPRGGSHVNRS